MTYSTSQVAKLAEFHPNTVRWYEEQGFLPAVPRLANGYRVFGERHVEQLRLIRLAMRSEILQSGLRQLAVSIVKLSAAGDYESAVTMSKRYLTALQKEREKAEEATRLVKNLVDGEDDLKLRRQEAADYLGITLDALRNWELNGLVKVGRLENGYRVYGQKEIRELKIIRTLRAANYSLMAILRLMNRLRNDKNTDLCQVLDTPDPEEDIVFVTDRLLTSLKQAEADALEMIEQLSRMRQNL